MTNNEKSASGWIIKNIIFNNILSSNGDIHRKVSLCLSSDIHGNTGYEWRIPFHSKVQKNVYGLVVKSNFGDLLDYTLEPYSEGEIVGQIAKIILKPHNKGDRTTLEISYLIPNYAKLLSKSFYSKFKSTYKFEWRYDFFKSPTERLEYRIKLPNDAKKVEHLSKNVGDYRYEYDNSEYVVFYTDKENGTNEKILSGSVTYQQFMMPLHVLMDMGLAFLMTVTALYGHPIPVLLCFLIYLIFKIKIT